MFPSATIAHHFPQLSKYPPLPLRALLLDDSLFDQKRILRAAAESGLTLDLDVVSSLADLSVQLDVCPYDLVFLDYILPLGTGRDALDMVRSHDLNRSCTAIMIAGDGLCDATAYEMLNACDTYICKDELSPERLRSEVLCAVGERLYARLDETPRNTSPEAGLPEVVRLETEIESVIREVRHLRHMAQCDDPEVSQKLAQLERRSIKLWTEMRTGTTVQKSKERFDLLENDHTFHGQH